MPTKVNSATHFGFDCRLIEIEVEIVSGLSSLEIVGLPDTAIKESGKRVYAAIKNCDAEYPRQRKIINLAPADVPKHGPSFDLPIAIGLLIASRKLDKHFFDDAIVIGELGLDGNVRKVRGAIGIAHFAKQNGFQRIILPKANAREAAYTDGIEIFPIEHLSQLLTGDIDPYQSFQAYGQNGESNGDKAAPDAESDIRGQEHAKRALMIAAAGRHNVLLSGPPGSGKTMLARAFPSLLPELPLEAAIEVTKIYSLAGKLSEKTPFISRPPFRPVHHTASVASLIGGGTLPRPGEISLAHKGVLFLDEMPEFSRSSLEALRQPLEDGTIVIHRAQTAAEFPAEFLLIGTANPCPCGYATDPDRKCLCSPPSIAKYRKKLSGPLLDRIDLFVEVPRLPKEKLYMRADADETALAREKIAFATALREAQNTKQQNGKCDFETIGLEPAAEDLLLDAVNRFHLSPRNYFRILRVSRTIANLELSDTIGICHVAEALQYRGLSLSVE